MGLWRELSGLSKPDPAIWYPVANTDDSDQLQAYVQAGRRLNLKMRVAYAVPAPAGRDYCASLGFKGIYIKQVDKDKKRELTMVMWDELRKIQGC